MPFKNKETQIEYYKKWYEANKSRRIDLVTANKKRISKYLNDYKVSKGCADCGYNENPVALDFDHLSDDKLFDLSDASNMGYSMKRISLEIDKCDVVCANHHRIRTNLRLRSSTARATLL